MRRSFIALVTLLGSSFALAAGEPAAPPKDAVEAAPLKTTAEAEIESLLRLGETKSKDESWEFARLAYMQVLNTGSAARPEQVRDALLGLARAHRGERQLTQACAIYERFIKDFPDDPRLPVVYLELGRCLRALGAYRLAIARFYSVLNSTLKLPEDGAVGYRRLARTAQFEIAETHALSGDHDQAARFYTRLSLLDFSPADRSRAAFKAASSLHLKGDHAEAVTRLRAYLSLYPDAADTAEARHILANSLRRLGRAEEALVVTLELLKVEKTRTVDPESWHHWQRLTGNQLANEFYEQGDFASALTLYQSLRELGGPREWHLPIQYQIALCQERMRQPDLARATYQSILASLRDAAPDAAALPALFQDLAAMVNIRLQHLDWLDAAARTLPPTSRSS